MTTQPETPASQPSTLPKELVGGGVLIVIGLLLLVAQFVRLDGLGWLVLPGLASIFLAAGLLARMPGLIIPGGILGGIGLGAWLVSGPYVDVAEPARGGVFLLAFAAGWALITLLTVFQGRALWWPLIPGTILALIGSALLAGGTAVTVLEWAGSLWPLALIAGGVSLLLRQRSR